ncbi:MAG: terminase family protein, partial [Fimbriimonadales bacterium]
MIAGWYPHPGQRAFLEASAPLRVLACGRRWGKTEVVAVECVRTLLSQPNRVVLIVAPSLEQALLPFERALQFLRQIGQVPKVRRTPSPSLALDGSRLYARSIARKGVYLRGRKAHLLIVDEAAYVPETVFREVLMPMVSDTGGRIALVSTPRGRNYFYQLYLQGQTDEGRVWSLRSPSWHNPLLSPSLLQMQASLMTPRQFQIEYGAEFVDPEGQVFQTDWVDRALLLDLAVEGAVCAGVDWARYRDWTACAVVQGTREGAKLLGL